MIITLFIAFPEIIISIVIASTLYVKVVVVTVP